jgi:hypothetical protein
MLFLLNWTVLVAQRDAIENNKIEYDRGLGLEAFFQHNYAIGVGGVIGKGVGHKLIPNYSIGLYTDVILTNTPIFGPRIKLSYNYLGFFGLNLNFSNYYRKGFNDFRITPEINFSLYGVVNLFVGYSFDIGKYTFNDLNNYRIGINLNLAKSEK